TAFALFLTWRRGLNELINESSFIPRTQPSPRPKVVHTFIRLERQGPDWRWGQSSANSSLLRLLGEIQGNWSNSDSGRRLRSAFAVEIQSLTCRNSLSIGSGKLFG